jgi:hypothetical protein
MTELPVFALSEGSSNPCVFKRRFSRKMTELVRLSPSESGHKKTPQAVAEGSGEAGVRAKSTWRRFPYERGRQLHR